MSSTKTRSMVDLAGRLETFRPADLMQFLAGCQKSGTLVLISEDWGRAECALRCGLVARAQHAHYEGEEAVLTVFGWTAGRFAFYDEADVDLSRTAFAVLPLVMEAARLEDELARFRDALPAPDQRLAVRGAAPPDQLHCGIPEVFAFLSAHPHIRRGDLERRMPLCPAKVRLAVAWLCTEALAQPHQEPRSPFRPASGFTQRAAQDWLLTS